MSLGCVQELLSTEIHDAVESGSCAGTCQTVLLHLQPTEIFVSNIENLAVSSSAADSGFGYPKGRSSLKSMYERVTVSCRVAQSGRVNLFHRQIVILPRNTQIWATYKSPGPRTPSGLPGTSNLYRLPPSLSSSIVSSD